MRRVFLLAALVLTLTVAPFVGAVSAGTIAVGETAGPVNLNNPGNVAAKLKRVTSGDANSAIGKYLQGRAKVIPGGDGSASMSVQWFGLSSLPDGGDLVGISPSLSTVVPVSSGTVPGGSEVGVAGDINGLIRAARTIAAGERAGDEQKEDDSDETASSGDVNSGGTVSNTGSGSPLEREDAKLPTITAAPATAAKEVVQNDVYGTTTDGCTPEFDEETGVVKILEAPTKNGKKDGECAPGVETAEVKETYIGCGYEVDADNEKAYAKKRRYYVWDGNSTDIDLECKKDEERSFAIVTTEDGCRVEPNLETMKAVQQTRMIYVGRENEEVPVAGEGCKEREVAKTFPITMEACELRDDFPAKRTYERKIATYVGPDGLKRNVGNCSDTGTYFVHHEDTSVCKPLADYENNKLFEQYRIRIDLDTGPKYRTPTCKPFAEALTDLLETPAGCESFHRDYDGYSLGGKRIVRKDTNAQMRECREADVRYEHEYVAEGWVRDDANLQATPQEATYITLPQPAGRTLIAQAAVRNGAEGQDYTFLSSRLEEGAPEYIPDSCQKYIKMKKMETWERPDGSEFVRQNGFGASQGPIYDCRIEVSTAWTKLRDHPARGEGSGQFWRACNSGNSPGNEHTVYRRNADYRGTKKLIRQGDGVVIDEVTADKTYQYCSGWCRSGGWNPPPCPSPLTETGKINQWRNELGWW